ncbi:YheT family hydrolase [Granulicella sibirica]|uniref:Hydrolase, alpha/beta fold family n=1 Tax=Granulicella sibirica TaxID=2479048 RepID=A0A4Q0SV96_9BACT|nr:alpha/beta fold hydrolase [Granulicella sibirica]RXH54282.1 Hydrolase, alpha/beta fold family [Granulicella sibirica]
MQASDSTATRSVEDSAPFSVRPFAPRRFLSNGHLQTIVGNFLPREDRLPAPEAQLVEVAPGSASQIATQVLCHCHWQPSEVRADRLTVILLHGLEGSSNSQYVVGNANKLWAAGMNVIRMNMRNCGGTEHLSPTLYHSGLSGDVRAVMHFFLSRERLEHIALVGYSMGGNLVLKLVGELGSEGPKQLRASVGVSPAVDLGPSADMLHRPTNRLYERRFLKALTRRFRKKAVLFPKAFDPAKAEGLSSLREFDDKVTAFYSGFSGANDYYFRAAAARVVDRIAIPTLILHADDDPFVHITPETRRKITANPHILMVEPQHGGHCAFLAEPDPSAGDDGYWAETTLLRFLHSIVR